MKARRPPGARETIPETGPKPIPSITPEALRRFWRGEQGEEPLVPVRPVSDRAERIRRACREYYGRHRDGLLARKRLAYRRKREA